MPSRSENPTCSRKNDLLAGETDEDTLQAQLPAPEQRHHLIVVRVREHIEHTRGDRLIGGHVR